MKHLLPKASVRDGKAEPSRIHVMNRDFQPMESLEQSKSGDSSKTGSRASLADQPEVEAMSSEENFSDHHADSSPLSPDLQPITLTLASMEAEKWKGEWEGGQIEGTDQRKERKRGRGIGDREREEGSDVRQ
ncbi:hypothetical protein Nepgr_004527 [Nepenthes gracilis]|uniref:Uncharacterized protein n=1 Tax=Nepenthes gracilis TaxID=150966 RepID=A0AAD3S1K9_NEPGR|nr:hypothetical protein Nepgr_004527 [Nepenthes gracilis]